MANNFSDIFNVALGKEFEDLIVEAMKAIYKENCVSAIGTDADKIQGTDVVLFGLPCDITADMADKDNTEIFSETEELDYTTVQFGVRTGNSHRGYTAFKEPVLVIGFYGCDLRWHMHDIVNELVRNGGEVLDKIINVGTDLYWNWVDEQGGIA